MLVANHLSLMDTPLLMAHIPMQFRFFAKEELFGVPFIGGHLTARRAPAGGAGKPARGAAAAERRRRALIRERRIAVLIFPEGGRSEGKLTEFREGAAYVAIKAGVPAVPVGITGTRGSLPMGSAAGAARARAV